MIQFDSVEEDLAYIKGMLHILNYCSAVTPDAWNTQGILTILMMALNEGMEKKDVQ